MPQNNLCFECMPVDPVHQWSTRTWCWTWCSIVGDHASTPSRPIQVYFKLIWIFSFLLTPRRIHLKKTSRSVEIEHVTEYAGAFFRRLHLWALRGHALQIILLLNLFFLLGGKCSRSSTTGWLVGWLVSLPQVSHGKEVRELLAISRLTKHLRSCRGRGGGVFIRKCAVDYY